MAAETSAKIIDGKSIAKQIRDEITVEISRMKDTVGVVPGLAVILVGDRKDSATYVRNKKKACESVGINSYEVHLSEDSTEQEVLKHISCFNDDPSVHGILVQLPLPSVSSLFCVLHFTLFFLNLVMRTYLLKETMVIENMHLCLVCAFLEIHKVNKDIKVWSING